MQRSVVCEMQWSVAGMVQRSVVGEVQWSVVGEVQQSVVGEVQWSVQVSCSSQWHVNIKGFLESLLRKRESCRPTF